MARQVSHCTPGKINSQNATIRNACDSLIARSEITMRPFSIPAFNNLTTVITTLVVIAHAGIV